MGPVTRLTRTDATESIPVLTKKQGNVRTLKPQRLKHGKETCDCLDHSAMRKELSVVPERVDEAFVKDICCKNRVAFGDKSNLSNISKSEVHVAGCPQNKRNSCIFKSKSNMDSSSVFMKNMRQSPETSGCSRNCSPRNKKLEKNMCVKNPRISVSKPFSVGQSAHKIEQRKDPCVHSFSKDSSSENSTSRKVKEVENEFRTPCTSLCVKNSRDLFNVDCTPFKKGSVRRSPRTSANKRDTMSNAKTTVQTIHRNKSDNSQVRNESPKIHSCVYSKVSRDTLINRNMPSEEKLAQYEFEVDENEPVVKRKRKRNVYGKRKQKNMKSVSECLVKSRIPSNKLQNTCQEICLKKQQPFGKYNKLQSYEESSVKGKSETVPETFFEKQPVSDLETRSMKNHESKNVAKSMRRNAQDIHIEKHVHFEEGTEVENISVESAPPGADKARSSVVAVSERNFDTYLRSSPHPLCEIHSNNMCETPKSGNSRPLGNIRRRNKKENDENISPIARPRRGRTPLRQLKKVEQFQVFDFQNGENSEGEISENQLSEQSFTQSNYSINGRLFEMSNMSPGVVKNISTINAADGKMDSSSNKSSEVVTNISIINREEANTSSVCGMSPRVVKNTSTINAAGGKTDSTRKKSSGVVNIISTINAEEKKSSSTPKPNSHSTPSKNNLQNVSVGNVRDIFSPISVTQSPNFSPLSATDKTGSTKNSFLTNVTNCLIPLSRKVFFLPRESGGGIVRSDKEVPKWDVVNCFGFEDEGNEVELPSASKVVSSQSLNSTCTVAYSKPLPTRVNVKRKLGSETEKTPCKTPRLEEKTVQVLTPRSESQNASKITPFSNPLKQPKLDFHIASPITPSKTNEVSSPVLFKDDDKTPIHFTEPPRKSYNRQFRRNLKFVGESWIEVDEDDEYCEKAATAHKKSKKHKINKQEKEAKKWIKEFNNQCEEIEDFELCVE